MSAGAVVEVNPGSFPPPQAATTIVRTTTSQIGCLLIVAFLPLSVDDGESILRSLPYVTRESEDVRSASTAPGSSTSAPYGGKYALNFGVSIFRRVSLILHRVTFRSESSGNLPIANEMIARSPKAASTSTLTLPRGTRIVEEALGVPAWVMLTRLFIGLGWLRAAAEKIIDPSWWSGAGVLDFIANQAPQTLGWYRPLADGWVSLHSGLVAAAVVVLQLVVAGSLISGRAVGYGLMIGMLLNLNFMAAGAVSPSVFYLLSQGALALWLAEQAGPRKLIPRLLTSIAVAAYILGVMSLPFIGTLHPARVIRDPGIMFVVVAGLTIIGCDLAHRRITGGRSLPPLAWLLRRQPIRR